MVVILLTLKITVGVIDSMKVNKSNYILLKITCGFAFLSWLFLTYFLISLLLYNIGLYNSFLSYWEYFLGAGLLSAVFYITTAWVFRCSNCESHFLIETKKEKSPNAQKYKRLNYWSTSVITVLFKNHFTCMYCGKQHYIKD